MLRRGMRGAGRGIILLERLLECSGRLAYPGWIKRALVNNRAFMFSVGVKVQENRKSRMPQVVVRNSKILGQALPMDYSVHFEKANI